MQRAQPAHRRTRPFDAGALTRMQGRVLGGDVAESLRLAGQRQQRFDISLEIEEIERPLDKPHCSGKANPTATPPR